jgi:hypothetical protein
MIRLDTIEKEDLKQILHWNEGKSGDFLLQWAGPLYEFPLTLKQLEEYILGEVQQANSGIRVYKIMLIETGEWLVLLSLRRKIKRRKKEE